MDQVRELLTIQGEITHAFFNGGEADAESWKHTERDLAAIAPPLTRIANRYDPIRAAAAAGDEVILASALSRYAARSYVQRRKAIALAQSQGPQPVTGREAMPESGPEHDEDWQRRMEADPFPDTPPALVPKGAR